MLDLELSTIKQAAGVTLLVVTRYRELTTLSAYPYCVLNTQEHRHPVPKLATQTQNTPPSSQAAHYQVGPHRGDAWIEVPQTGGGEKRSTDREEENLPETEQRQTTRRTDESVKRGTGLANARTDTEPDCSEEG